VDHAATLEQMYERIDAHGADGSGEHLADDFVEHEAAPGLAPTGHGVLQFLAIYCAGFPDLRFDASTRSG
jgi:hypothetical protein